MSSLISQKTKFNSNWASLKTKLSSDEQQFGSERKRTRKDKISSDTGKKRRTDINDHLSSMLVNLI